MAKYDNEARRLAAASRSALVGPRDLALALSAIGCGSSPAPKARTAGSAEGEETGTMGGEATEHDTISKAGAAELIPKEKKRAITEDQRADFEKAMQRYAVGQEVGRPLGLASAAASPTRSSRSPTATPACSRRASTRAPCWPSAAGRTTPSASGRGMTAYGPAIANLGYLAWKRGEPQEAESLFNQAIEDDPLHTVEARNNLAQILRDKARRARAPTRRRSTSRRRSATCAPCSRSTATTCRRSRRWRSSTTT